MIISIKMLHSFAMVRKFQLIASDPVTFAFLVHENFFEHCFPISITESNCLLVQISNIFQDGVDGRSIAETTKD